MSIASLFKPVDSSKTRLPRTDVLERVAKYADGDLVISSYLDISTDELIKMLRNDLVPASRLEEVQNIVRTRLSGETTAAPKKSVGETISTKPIKEFTVSDPTKDFITPESVVNNAKGFIDASSAPSGFERGNYLESLIGSGKTGGAPQRGSPAKDKDYTDPLNARPDAPPARLGLEGLTPGRRPSGGMSYTPEAPEDSASIRQAALGSAEDRQNALDFLKKNQAVIDYYSKQRGEDPTGVGINTDQKVGDDLQKRFKRETLGTGGFFANDPPAFVAGADPTRTTNIPVLQDFQRGTGSDGDFGSGYSKTDGARSFDPTGIGRDSTPTPAFISGTDPSNISADTERKYIERFDSPRSDKMGQAEIATMSSPDPRNLENTGLIDTLKRYLGPTPVQQAVSQMKQELTDAEKAERKAQPTQRLRPPVSSTLEPPVKKGTSFTEFLYGRPEAQRMEEEATATAAAEAADKATTDRMNAREAGISALPSDVGAATDKSGGIVPARNNDRGVGEPTAAAAATAVTAPPASIGGRYVSPTSETSSRDSAPSTSSQPSATPTTDYRAAPDTSTVAPVTPDKPTKDDKKAIQETANEVAKNPSVGGIQSLFEQAGFSDALLQLGLGMMASKNPDFLGALGESGQSAVALMAKQREAAKKAKDDADKLALEERRVAAQEADVKNRGDADKTPAAMKNAKYLADATIIAKKQKEAGQYGTTEQLYVMNQTRSDLASIAEKAGQSSSNNWQSGMNKILAMDSDTKRAKEARAAAIEQYYKTNGSTAEEAYNQGITRSLNKLDPEGLLSIGIAPVQNTVQKYDVATGTLIK